MRVAVHFEVSEGGSVYHKTKIVETDFLEEEMDAIEFAHRKDETFCWLPFRDLQIKLIKTALPDMFVDPLHFSYDFRRAVINQKGVSNAKLKK